MTLLKVGKMRIWGKRSQITVFFLPKILENCPEKHQETPYENPLGANFRVFLHFLWGVNLCAEFGCFFEKSEKTLGNKNWYKIKDNPHY